MSTRKPPADHAGPPLILPPGYPQEQAQPPIVEAPKLPFLFRAEAQAVPRLNGTGLRLVFTIALTPLSGQECAILLEPACHLSELSRVLREAADAFDTIAARVTQPETTQEAANEPTDPQPGATSRD